MSVIVKVTAERRHGRLGRDVRHRRAARGHRDHRRRAGSGDRRPRRARRRRHPGGPVRPHARARLSRRLLRRRDRRRGHRAVGPLPRSSRDCRSSKLLGGQRADRLPAYVSGLPRATLAERVALAREWVGQGLRRDQVRGRRVARRHRRGDARAARGARSRRQADGRPPLEVHGRGGDPAASTRWRRTVRTSPRRRARRRTSTDSRRSPRAARVPIAAGEEWRDDLRSAAAARATSRVGAAARDGPHRRHAVPRDRPACGGVPRARDAAREHRRRASSRPRACTRRRRCPTCRITNTSIRSSTRTCATSRRRCAARQATTTCPTGPGLGVEPKPELWNFVVN